MDGDSGVKSKTLLSESMTTVTFSSDLEAAEE
jgi:hypothetical protein